MPLSEKKLHASNIIIPIGTTSQGAVNYVYGSLEVGVISALWRSERYGNRKLQYLTQSDKTQLHQSAREHLGRFDGR